MNSDSEVKIPQLMTAVAREADAAADAAANAADAVLVLSSGQFITAMSQSRC